MIIVVEAAGILKRLGRLEIKKQVTVKALAIGKSPYSGLGTQKNICIQNNRQIIGYWVSNVRAYHYVYILPRALLALVNTLAQTEIFLVFFARKQFIQLDVEL